MNLYTEFYPFLGSATSSPPKNKICSNPCRLHIQALLSLSLYRLFRIIVRLKRNVRHHFRWGVISSLHSDISMTIECSHQLESSLIPILSSYPTSFIGTISVQSLKNWATLTQKNFPIGCGAWEWHHAACSSWWGIKTRSSHRPTGRQRGGVRRCAAVIQAPLISVRVGPLAQVRRFSFSWMSVDIFHTSPCINL